MALADQRAKSAKMASDMVKKGIFHGKRLTRPYANSGGLTMVQNTTGSAKYQRLVAKRQAGQTRN